MSRNPTTYHRRHYTLSLSPRGTARITFADGHRVTLTKQASPALAVLRAWRLCRKEA